MDHFDNFGGRRTGASPEAIMSHYDMGNDFFRLILGPELIYSCALFNDNDDLDSAQLRKLDYHIDAAQARGVESVLDIGCGWGAMLRRLINSGVKRCVGLTLSPSQAAWIRDHSQHGQEVLEQDWRDHKPARPYDAIVSIGAFEHFVQKGLTPAERLKTYQEFFDFCRTSLRPSGRLSLQTIAYIQPTALHPYLEEAFPDSDLPLVWEPLAAAEGRFRLLALHDHGSHYERTLRIWEQALEENHKAAVDLVGAPALQMFQRYLRLSRLGFRHGIVGLLRMNFVRID